jgi:accessory colonization factor AcfC
MGRMTVLVLPLLFLAGSAPSSPAAIGGSLAPEAPVLSVYGPGGPAPALREAAALFGQRRGLSVQVTAGPTPHWKESSVEGDADLIYSGSEHMMTDFLLKDFEGFIDRSTLRSLYLRPSAILVRPGNPKRIGGVRDLGKPGLEVLVVQDAGQVGLWEDVVGRTGDVRLLEAVRRNIGAYASNSAEAKKLWSDDAEYDAWLIWTIWQKENPAAADLVPVEPEHTIYRSCGIAGTLKSARKDLAAEFVRFLESGDGRAIFVKWGWRTR